MPPGIADGLRLFRPVGALCILSCSTQGSARASLALGWLANGPLARRTFALGACPVRRYAASMAKCPAHARQTGSPVASSPILPRRIGGAPRAISISENGVAARMFVTTLRSYEVTSSLVDSRRHAGGSIVGFGLRWHQRLAQCFARKLFPARAPKDRAAQTRPCGNIGSQRQRVCPIPSLGLSSNSCNPSGHFNIFSAAPPI